MIPSERMSTGLSLTCEDYMVMESTKLKTLPKRKLHEIIYRFDTEVAILKNKVESAASETIEKAAEASELREQLNFVKETNQLLSSELLKAHQTNSENEKKLTEALKLLESESNTDSEEPLHKVKLKLQQAKSKKRQLKEELEAFQEKAKDMVKVNSNREEELEKLRFSKESLEFEVATVKESLSKKNKALKEALKATQTKNNNKKERLSSLESLVKELQSEIINIKQKSQTELDKSLRENEALREELQESRKKFEVPEEEEKNTEILRSLKTECEAMKLKYVRSLQNNDKLIKKIVDLKQKQMNARQEVMKLSHRIKAGSEPNTPMNSHLKNSPWMIKSQLSLIYKDFIGEIQQSTDGNKAFYTMDAEQFSSFEKRLNELISVLHETLEESEEDFSSKAELGIAQELQPGRSYLYDTMHSYDGIKKRASSLRPIVNNHN